MEENLTNIIHFSEEQMKKYEDFISKNYSDKYSILHELASPDIHLDILVIEPTKENDYYTLITMGMSEYKMNIPEDLDSKEYERAELVMYLPSTWNINSKEEKDYWPLRILKYIARMPIYADSWLTETHIIKNDNNEPFNDDTNLCGVLVLPSANEKCVIDDDFKVNIYELMFLYEEELNYLEQNDFNDFMDLCEKKELPYPPVLDIKRKNICK